MNYFEYRNDELFAEEVSLRELARRFGTPFYVYSARTLRRHFRVFDEAFAGTDHLICYAMKALSNLSILKMFASMGSGFDIVSVGELMRCLRASADPRKIVFSGVGKTDEEIAAALEHNILMINVESRPELHRVSEVAGRMKKRAPVSLRVNPDLDPGTHPHISTGHRDSKFGIPLSQVDEYYAEARNLPNLELAGLSTHIGSQITDTAPFTEAGNKVAAIIGRLRGAGISSIKYLDIGGGLGIPYQEEPPPPSEYGKAVLKPLAGLGTKNYRRAGTRDRRQRGRAGHQGSLSERNRRETFHHRRCRDERSDPAGAVRGVSCDSARAENRASEKCHCRCGRTGVRERRFPCARARDARTRGGRSVGRDERRRVWGGDGVELQQPSSNSGDSGRWGRCARDPRARNFRGHHSRRKNCRAQGAINAKT